MRQILYIALIVVFLFLSILSFVIFREKSVTDLETAYISNPIPQVDKKRVWIGMDFREVGISNEFISSSHMRFDENDYIYIADNNDQTVKRFDLNAEINKTYGKGEGRGPGEFLTIIDLLIGEDKKLWVVDDRNNRVTIFDTENDQSWNILNLEYAFNKILPLGSENYWFERKFNNQMEIYHISGEFLGRVEPIVNDPQLWAYVLEGFYALISGGGVVQSQYHTNKIVKYSRNGEILFFREPIEFLGLPKINPHYANDVARINTVDFSSWLQVTSDPQVAGSFLHVFVKQKDFQSNEWEDGFIDVYNLTSGDYQFSYHLPERVETLAISSTHIAGISEELGRLLIWEVKER